MKQHYVWLSLLLCALTALAAEKQSPANETTIRFYRFPPDVSASDIILEPITIKKKGFVISPIDQFKDESQEYSLDVTYPKLKNHPDPRIEGRINRMFERLLFLGVLNKTADNWWSLEFIDLDTIDSHGVELITNFNVGIQQDNLLSIEQEYWSMIYKGANGIDCSITLTLNLSNGRIYQLDDLFVKNYSPKFLEIVNQTLKAKIENAKEVKKVTHFLITPKNFKVIFDEYEVAAGFHGKVKIDIPYRELEEFIDKKCPLAGFLKHAEK